LKRNPSLIILNKLCSVAKKFSLFSHLVTARRFSFYLVVACLFQFFYISLVMIVGVNHYVLPTNKIKINYVSNYYVVAFVKIIPHADDVILLST